MSRTFEQVLAERDVHLAFYCTIAGLPYVFADFDQPGHWSIPSGMTWSRTLVPFVDETERMESSLESFSEQVDWKTGMVETGHLDLDFRVDEDDPDDVWLNLVAPTTRNTWLVDGTHVYSPSMNLWLLLSTSSLQGNVIEVGNVVHSGIGCAEVLETGLGPGRGIKVELNKFDSYFDWRGSYGRVQGAPQPGDVEVTDWPKVWRRRRVSVWVELCYRDRNGYRVPISDSYKQVDGAGREIFPGVVSTAPVWHPGDPMVTVMCQDATQYLESSIVKRSRKYRPGPATLGMGSCYVERSGPCLVEVSFTNPVTTGETVHVFDLTNTASTGLAESFVGRKTADEVAAVIVELLEHWFGGTPGYLWTASPESPEPPEEIPEGFETERSKYRFGVAFKEADGDTRQHLFTVRFNVKTAQEPDRSIFPALGIEEDLVFQGVDDLSSAPYGPPVPYTYETGSEPIPHVYFARGNNRLYYHGKLVPNGWSHDPPVSQGTFDQNGAPDWCYVRFGEHEIMKVQFRDPVSGQLYFDTDPLVDPYMKILEREKMGGQLAVSVPVDEIEGEEHQIVLGLGFFDHDLRDVMLQLLVSNGDPATGGPWDDPVNLYNVLPQGFGAEMPPSLVDLDSFELTRLNSTQPKAYGLWIEQSLTMRELLAEIAVATGVNFVLRWAGAYRKLGAVRVEPAAGTDPVAVIDDSWVDDVNHPVEPNYDELEVGNNILFEYDYDPLQDKFHGVNNSFVDANSIANYGLSRPIEMRVRWVSSIGDADGQLAGIAAAMFRRFADPLIGYKITYVRPEGWLLVPGDEVDVTKSRLVNYREGGLGLTNAPMRVEHHENHYGTQETFGIVKVSWWERRSAIPWSPCIRLKSLVSGSTYLTYRRGEAGAFTPYEDGREDVEFFQAGEKVVPYLPGEDTKGAVRTIVSVDAATGEIELDDVTGASVDDGIVLEPVAYDNATIALTQLDTVFMVDDEGKVVDASAEASEGARWG